jgi:hypothetical protein
MKKISVISAVIIVFATVIMAFTLNNTNSTSTPILDTQVIMHVIGCPNCKSFSYCLDGGPIVFVGSCDFSFNCSDGPHDICLMCDGGPGGSLYSFEATGGQLELKVSLAPLTACNCGKKKK